MLLTRMGGPVPREAAHHPDVAGFRGRVRLLHGWPPSAETVNRIDPPSAACRRGARCPAELEGAGDLRPDHRVELAVGELVGVFADALATVVVRVVNVPNQFTAACSRPSAPWLSATSYTW